MRISAQSTLIANGPFIKHTAMLKTLISIILSKFVPLVQEADRRYKVTLLENHPNIFLGKNVHIEKTAKIEIVNGGKIRVGSNTALYDGVLLETRGGNITIGDNCSINAYTVIYGHGNTKIGNNVLIAGHCMVIPNSHNYKNPHLKIMEQGSTKKGIVIGDDVWIGHGCSILDGVTIGKGSVIAAGSVVNRSIPPYHVIGGVPAKFIKKRRLPTKEKKSQQE